MDISTTYIEERFHHFNRLCFDGKLIMPPIRLSRSRRALGQVRFRRRRCGRKMEFYNFDFAISCLLAKGMGEREVEDTILHEMIHYYILSNQMQDTSPHGRLFKSEMERINHAFNRHVAISHRSSPDEHGDVAEEDVRTNVLAVLRFSDNRWGVIVVARTRVFQIWNELEHVSEVKQAHWFVSNNAFFSRFPRRTTLRYYPIEAFDLLEKLTDARLLVREGNKIVVRECDIQKLLE